MVLPDEGWRPWRRAWLGQDATGHQGTAGWELLCRHACTGSTWCPSRLSRHGHLTLKEPGVASLEGELPPH